jgi:hypothetical protein
VIFVCFAGSANPVVSSTTPWRDPVFGPGAASLRVCSLSLISERIVGEKPGVVPIAAGHTKDVEAPLAGFLDGKAQKPS